MALVKVRSLGEVRSEAGSRNKGGSALTELFVLAMESEKRYMYFGGDEVSSLLYL